LSFGVVALAPEGDLMRQYRIYRMAKDGHIIGAAEIVECANDAEALQKAQQAIDGHSVELWESSRRLCRLLGSPYARIIVHLAAMVVAASRAPSRHLIRDHPLLGHAAARR
jgi:hypothetical protein